MDDIEILTKAADELAQNRNMKAVFLCRDGEKTEASYVFFAQGEEIGTSSEVPYPYEPEKLFDWWLRGCCEALSTLIRERHPELDWSVRCHGADMTTTDDSTLIPCLFIATGTEKTEPTSISPVQRKLVSGAMVKVVQALVTGEPVKLICRLGDDALALNFPDCNVAFEFQPHSFDELASAFLPSLLFFLGNEVRDTGLKGGPKVQAALHNPNGEDTNEFELSLSLAFRDKKGVH